MSDGSMRLRVKRNRPLVHGIGTSGRSYISTKLRTFEWMYPTVQLT